MRNTGHRIVAIAALSAAVAVALGAFGAHLLAGRVPADMLVVYETAARYHFYHSLGMIGVGLLALHRAAAASGSGDAAANPSMRRLRWSAALMLTGIALFSGSLYAMALSGMRWLGAVTPLGGIAFLAAWGLLAWAALEE